MAIANKTLTAVGDNIALPIEYEWNGIACAQLISGTDTYVFEGTLNGVDWSVLTFVNAATKVTAASFSAIGLYYVEFVAYKSVRVRKTVGVTGAVVYLSVANG